MAEGLGKYWRRAGRLIRFAIRPPDVSLVHHPDYADFTAAGLSDPARADKILAFLTDAGVIRRHNVSRPLAGSLEDILAVHSPEYVEALSDRAVVGEILGLDLAARTAQEALDVARLMVGGTIHAMRLARKSKRVAVHLGGGLHHAMPGEGMGFCIFNDVAVAITRLRNRGFRSPILVVDLDLHDGNGTRAVFAKDPSVFTFSIHNVDWDTEPAVSSRSIALGSGVSDDVLMNVLAAELPPIIEQHQPGLVVYVAGVDGAITDAIGDWRLTAEGILERDRFVVEAVRAEPEPPPLAIVLGGGYGASAWRYTARFLGWLVAGETIEPPDEMEMVLRRSRELMKGWKPSAASVDTGSEWALKEEDLFGFGVHEDPLFLGHFSKYAVELQLEQLGVLNHIRARGFPHLSVTLDVRQGLGQVLRVRDAPNGGGPLVELKATRSRAVLPGAEVIEINWLLLQNPKASFGHRRPQLPGQHHPGLGMLREVAAWLIVVCEELRLDGIAFVPSQYYMAAVGHRHLQFVDPTAQAKYEAFRRALRGLDLATANNLLNKGDVIDTKTGAPVTWEPVPMVVPVSQALLERTMNPAYSKALGAARAEFEFALRG
ncbi:MAG: histone deacetylase [Gemmatimonadales bacterium]|jgi:acetoin utilization deacetylase AcuC-like enzyme